MKILPLQLNGAVTALLDYGLIAILLVVVGYFAWHLYKIQEENSKEWKQEAKANAKLITDLAVNQNSISEKQLEIQKESNKQNKEFHDNLNQKFDGLPERIIKEMQYQKLLEVQSKHTTPAP